MLLSETTRDWDRSLKVNVTGRHTKNLNSDMLRGKESVYAAVADESQRVGAESVVRIVTPLPYLTIVLTVCIIFASNYSQSPLISPNDDMS